MKLLKVFMLIILFIVCFKIKNLEYFDSVSYNHYNDDDLLEWISLFPYHMYHTYFYNKDIENNWSINNAFLSQPYIASKYINPNDKIIDIGCGWCGSVKYIKNKYNNIHVTVLTNSKQALSFCKKDKKINNFIYGDFTKIKINDYYDVAIMMESFFYMGSNLNEKINILKKVRNISSKFIGFITCNSSLKLNELGSFWGNSGYHMSPSTLYKILKLAKWNIKVFNIQNYCDKRYINFIVKKIRNKLIKDKKNLNDLPHEIKLLYTNLKNLNNFSHKFNNNYTIAFVVAE